MKKRSHRIIKAFGAALIAAVVISVIPLVSVYFKPDPKIITNKEAVGKLKNNKGNYFEFIIVSDVHSGLFIDDSAALKTVRHINREGRFKKVPVDFVIEPGDLTFRGSKWDYRMYNKIKSAIKYPVISAFGNHDNDNNGGRWFDEYIGDREFAFADRNSYFIILDNSEGGLTDKQFNMFEDELKKGQSYSHRFVVLHKPPRSLYQQSWYRPEFNPWVYKFMKLCEMYKVDMVIAGHEHLFKSQDFGGVKYVMAGSGGIVTQVPSSDGAFLQYLVVRVYHDYVDYEVRKVFPPLWEFLAYYMWKDIFYTLRDIVY